MKVVFEIDKKTLAVAKAVLLQAADNEIEEKDIEAACLKCEGDTIVQIDSADVASDHMRKIQLSLAIIVIGKLMVDHEV